MKNSTILPHLFLIIIFSIIITFCGKTPTEPDNSSNEQVTLSGKVIDFDDGSWIVNAAIKIIVDSVQFGAITNTEGKYTKTFNLKKNVDIRVIAIKEKYRSDSTTVFAVPGRTIEVPTLKLKKDSSLVATTSPASIVLISQTHYQIGVRESGDNETTTLTFEVRDSSGRPLDISNSVDVRFLLGASPGGGEFIYPNIKKTNSEGRASVGLTSGTKAGVVQIIAEVTHQNRTIRSKPVNVAIHGGLPDLNHFSIISDLANIPGLVVYGFENTITAFVGDKYSNPVKPNTVVYFNTTGGIIQGSSVSTGNDPRVSVKLITSAPYPIDPVLGPGFAKVTASTADENNQNISKSTVVLFSGFPINFSVSPTSFNIPNGGMQTFNYIVADENNNPISSGNKITVTVEGNVRARGDININMPDTQSRNWTMFSFSLEDSDPTRTEFSRVYVKIEVSGISGTNVINIQGTSY